jgi:DNA-binding CsgD family transcriptional regulator
MLELGEARWNEALEQFGALADAHSPGSVYISAVSAADRVEAAVHAGQLDAARSALEQFEAWAGSSQASWVPARLACSRALVAEGDAAIESFEEALRHAESARPFDLGRIRLAYGECLRRQRRRVDARAQLRAALEIFDRLRAEPWAERARTELRASGESARKRDPSTISELTPQELQVARFVADGLSNKEVATQLFLSPRTIDAHLRNVFSKLGITSRVQLARLPLGAEGLSSERGALPSPA